MVWESHWEAVLQKLQNDGFLGPVFAPLHCFFNTSSVFFILKSVLFPNFLPEPFNAYMFSTRLKSFDFSSVAQEPSFLKHNF